MKLNIYKETKAILPLKKLNRLFNMITTDENIPKRSGMVNLIFTTDKKIRALNKQFRAVDKSTDVLSFNIDQPCSKDSVFGEIYISLSTARRQASDYRSTLSAELVRLVCHGLLHLFGYDHIKKKDASIMKKHEEYYLNNI